VEARFVESRQTRSDILVADYHRYDDIDDRETPEHAQTRLRGFLGYSFETIPETCESLCHALRPTYLSPTHYPSRHLNHFALVYASSAS